MSEDRIAITGVVASSPRHIVTAEGVQITSFRLASNARRYDRAAGTWVDAETNWYTVTAFRQLAGNAAACIAKGERVAVQGRLRVRQWASGERSGTQVEVEADSIGHDLSWGTSSFVRALASATPPEPSSENGAGGPLGAGESPAPVPAAWTARPDAGAATHSDHGPRGGWDADADADADGDPDAPGLPDGWPQTTHAG